MSIADLAIFLGVWTLTSIPLALLFGRTCSLADRYDELCACQAALSMRGHAIALPAPALALPRLLTGTAGGAVTAGR